MSHYGSSTPPGGGNNKKKNAVPFGYRTPPPNATRRPSKLLVDLLEHGDRHGKNPPTPDLQKQVLQVLGVEEFNDHFISPLSVYEGFSDVGWKKVPLPHSTSASGAIHTPSSAVKKQKGGALPRPKTAMSSSSFVTPTPTRGGGGTSSANNNNTTTNTAAAAASATPGSSPASLRDKILRECQLVLSTPNQQQQPQQQQRALLSSGKLDAYRHHSPIKRPAPYGSGANVHETKGLSSADPNSKKGPQKGSSSSEDAEAANLLTKYFSTGGSVDVNSYMRRMQAYQRALHSLEPMDDPAIEHTVDTTFGSLEGVGNRLSHMIRSLESGDDYLPSLAVVDGQSTGGYFRDAELTRIMELEKAVKRLLVDIAAQQRTIRRLEGDAKEKDDLINSLRGIIDNERSEARRGEAGDDGEGDQSGDEYYEDDGLDVIGNGAADGEDDASGDLFSFGDFDAAAAAGGVDSSDPSVLRRRRQLRMLSLFGNNTALTVRRGTATRAAMIQHVRQSISGSGKRSAAAAAAAASSSSATQDIAGTSMDNSGSRGPLGASVSRAWKGRKSVGGGAIRRKPRRPTRVGGVVADASMLLGQSTTTSAGTNMAMAASLRLLPSSSNTQQQQQQVHHLRALSNKEGFVTERLRPVDEAPLSAMVRPSVTFPFVQPPSENATFLAMRVPMMEKLYQRDSAGASKCLQIYVQIVEHTISKCRGYVLQTDGDMYTAAFHDPLSAVMCAQRIQCLCVENEQWPSFLEDDPATITARIEITKTVSGTFTSQVIAPDGPGSPLGPLDSPTKNGGDEEKNGADEEAADFAAANNNPNSSILTIWRGLRVSMAINQASAPPCQLDLCSLKMHYYGYPVHYLRFLLSLALGGMIVIDEEMKEVIEMHHIQLEDPLSVFHLWAVPPTPGADSSRQQQQHQQHQQQQQQQHQQPTQQGGGGGAVVHDPESGAHAAIKVYRLTTGPLFKRNDDFDVEMGRLYPPSVYRALTRELSHPSQYGDELSVVLRRYLPPPKLAKDEKAQQLKSGDFCVMYICIPANLEMLSLSDEASVSNVVNKFIAMARDSFKAIETPVTEVAHVKDRMLLLFVNPIEAVKYAMVLFQRVFRSPWGSESPDLQAFTRARSYRKKVVSAGPPLVACIHQCKLRARRSLFAAGCGSESIPSLPGTNPSSTTAAPADGTTTAPAAGAGAPKPITGSRGSTAAGDFVTGAELSVLWAMANANPQASSITISEIVYAYSLFQLQKLNSPIIEPCGLIPFTANFDGPMPVYNLTSVAFVGRCAVLRGLEDGSAVAKAGAVPFNRNYVREYLTRLHRISIRAQPWALPGVHLLGHSDCINNPSLQSVLTRTHFEKRKVLDAAEQLHLALHAQYVDPSAGWGGVENREALEQCEGALMFLYDDLLPSTTPPPTIQLGMFDLVQLMDSCGSGNGPKSKKQKKKSDAEAAAAAAAAASEGSVSQNELKALVKDATEVMIKEKETAVAAFDLERQFFQETLRKMNSQILMTHQLIHFFFNGIKNYLAPLIDDAAPRVHDDDFIIQLVQTHRELERRMKATSVAEEVAESEGGEPPAVDVDDDGEPKSKPKQQPPRIAQEWKGIMASTLDIHVEGNLGEVQEYDVVSVCRSIIGHAFRSFVFLRTLSRRVSRIVESAADTRPVNKVLAATNLKEHATTGERTASPSSSPRQSGKKKK